MNSFYTMWENLTKYITEGVARIFSPNDDQYPNIGIQPFEGEPYHNTSEEW